MEIMVDLLKKLLIQMGVDLRGGDVGMAEHFLDDTQVGAVSARKLLLRVPSRVGPGRGAQRMSAVLGGRCPPWAGSCLILGTGGCSRRGSSWMSNTHKYSPTARCAQLFSGGFSLG